jgi:hypothetical protein
MKFLGYEDVELTLPPVTEVGSLSQPVEGKVQTEI